MDESEYVHFHLQPNPDARRGEEEEGLYWQLLQIDEVGAKF